jgi:ADP-heptose:LPS heptosyltransferase
MTLRGQLPSDGGENVVIIKPSSLGDVVHTLPAVRSLKRTFPQLQISWIINPELRPLLDGNRDLMRIIPFPRREFGDWLRVPHAIRWFHSLRRIPVDLVLDFQGLLRSAFMAQMFPRALRFGLADAREGSRWLYHRVASVDPNEHAVDRYLRLAELAGAKTDPTPDCVLPPGSWIHDLELPSKFVLLHPFARGSGKSLRPAEITQLCAALQPTPVVVVGRGSHKISVPAGCFSLVDQTNLHQLIYLIRQATFVVSVDSGPMHLAAAAARGLLSIHFWSDPRKVGPYRPDAWVWKNGKIVRVSDIPPEPTIAESTRLRPEPEMLGRFVLGQIQ